LTDDQGRIFAFEIDNASMSRRMTCRIAQSVPGANITRTSGLFSWFTGPDDFCEFELDGVTFVVWEPFGDNSRFWVGTKPPRWVSQLGVVRETFARA